MKQILLLVLIHIYAILEGFAQPGIRVFAQEAKQAKKINLQATIKSGDCRILSSHHTDPISVYNYQNIQTYNKILQSSILHNIHFITFTLPQDDGMGVGQNISHHFFGRKDTPANAFWTVYLTDAKPYTIDLDYGMGEVNMDLSGLSIDKLKIQAGFVDINTFYQIGSENPINMDTFLIQADVGLINARKLNQARSKVIIAEVGFGSIFLDLSEMPTAPIHVMSSVGTGNLVVRLPNNRVPVKIELNDSWLCDLNLYRNFREVVNNVFVNEAYLNEAPNQLTFKIDVSMGMVVFE